MDYEQQLEANAKHIGKLEKFINGALVGAEVEATAQQQGAYDNIPMPGQNWVVQGQLRASAGYSGAPGPTNTVAPFGHGVVGGGSRVASQAGEGWGGERQGMYQFGGDGASYSSRMSDRDLRQSRGPRAPSPLGSRFGTLVPQVNTFVDGKTSDSPRNTRSAGIDPSQTGSTPSREVRRAATKLLKELKALTNRMQEGQHISYGEVCMSATVANRGVWFSHWLGGGGIT